MLSFDLRGIVLIVIVVVPLLALSAIAGWSSALVWSSQERVETELVRAEAWRLVAQATVALDDCRCALTGECGRRKLTGEGSQQ